MTDNELLYRIRQSDRAAFFIFFRRYWKALYLHVRRGTCDEDRALDLVYVRFAELWDQRRQIQQKGFRIDDWFNQTQPKGNRTSTQRNESELARGVRTIQERFARILNEPIPIKFIRDK